MTQPNDSMSNDRNAIPNPNAGKAGADRGGGSQRQAAGPMSMSGGMGRTNEGSKSGGGSTSSRGASGGDIRGAERGRGDLRQAVNELAQSIECLCDESHKDRSGAKRHLDQAKRFLGESDDAGSRLAPGRASTQGSIGAASERDDDETSQRSMRS